MPRDDDKKPSGKAAVVVAIDDAQRELARKKRGGKPSAGGDPPAKRWRDDPPPERARNGVRPNGKGAPPNWTANHLGLPSEDPCPVTALGSEIGGKGKLYHLIDSAGLYQPYGVGDFSHAGMQSLFSLTPNWPAWAFPRHGRAKKVIDEHGERIVVPIESFHDDGLRLALMQACDRAGQFSPAERLRGRGMWRTRAGGLNYHSGEELWVWDEAAGHPVATATGLVDGYLYARYPSLPAPWPYPVTADDNPAGDLLSALRCWSYERQDVDPVLLLGWIGTAYLGAALDWRANALILGGYGTGKSELQGGLKSLFGEALFDSADTSAAGIYQDMRHDARPIGVDESEPDESGRSRIADVVRLMRASASGAKGRRGSSGGQGSQFQLRSAFLFSAINNPLHDPQDLSRVTILRLKELPHGATKPPVIDADTLGRKLLTILMREWPRFDATRDLYMQALLAGGHVARGQKTYGTLLAAADLLLGPELGELLGVATAYDCEGRINAPGLEWWSQHLSTDLLPEVQDAVQNWVKCVHALLRSPMEGMKNGRVMNVSAIIQEIHATADQAKIEQARRDLATAGLGLVVSGEKPDIPKDAGYLLAVPGDHPMLRRLLKDTPWRSGGWSDALRQCPDGLGVMFTAKRFNRVQIENEQIRCTLVSMRRFKEAVER